MVKAYPVGREVSVYYDPLNPREAVRERRPETWDVHLFLIGAGLAVGSGYILYRWW